MDVEAILISHYGCMRLVYLPIHEIHKNEPNLGKYLRHQVCIISVVVWKDWICSRFAEKRSFSPKNVVSVIGINIIDKNQGQKFHQKQPVGKKHQKTHLGREMSPFGWQMSPFQNDAFFEKKT